MLDLAVERDAERLAPLVALHRPDVVEYLTHIRSERVGRFDLATGFVFAIPAASFDGVALRLQGSLVQLHPRSHHNEPGVAFLQRYVEALQHVAASPALAAVSRHFQDIRVEHHARPTPVLDEVGGAGRRVACVRRARIAGCLCGRRTSVRVPPPAALDGRLALLAVHPAQPVPDRLAARDAGSSVAEGFRAVLINSAPGSEAGLAELDDGLCAGLVRRSDYGRDIASWLLALSLLEGRLDGLDQILLCNDSFFGPFGQPEGTVPAAGAIRRRRLGAHR